jgi:hypothetical protein
MTPAVVFGQAGASALVPNDVTVGQNLETIGTVTLKGPTTREPVEVTVTSGDPKRVLLSATPEAKGSASIVIKAAAGFRETPVFFIQGLAKSGSVTYTASASGFTTGTGTVTLAPSGLVITGSFGVGRPSFLTSVGGEDTKITVLSAQLDDALNYVAQQRVAPGRSITAAITNSNATVGSTSATTVTIPGGSASAMLDFKALAPGETKLGVSAPAGFSTPVERFATVTAKVFTPGMVLDDVVIGQNLQVTAHLGLGGPATGEGVVVTIKSDDPTKLLVSNETTKKGSDTIQVRVPAGDFRGGFVIQALGGSGTATYTATAPGFRSKTAKVTLTPSGVVVAGPLSFTRSGASPGFVTSLASGQPTQLLIYTVYLDPVTHRSADVTVQPLRAGLDLRIQLTTSNPEIGTVVSPVTIKGGSDTAESVFKPLKAGMTAASILTPDGYTQSSNATSLKVIVTE